MQDKTVQVTKPSLLKTLSSRRCNLVYEAWTDEGYVYTVSVENRKCVEPKKTMTYSGQTHTAVRYCTSGLTGSNIQRTQIWSCAPGGAGRKDGRTNRPSVVT